MAPVTMENAPGGPDTQYLGDGLYAAWEGWAMRLWTDTGSGPENVIWLEPAVYACLVDFWTRNTAAPPGV